MSDDTTFLTHYWDSLDTHEQQDLEMIIAKGSHFVRVYVAGNPISRLINKKYLRVTWNRNGATVTATDKGKGAYASRKENR